MRAEILPDILQRLGIPVTTTQWYHEKNKLTEHWTEHVGRDTCSSLEPRTPQAHEQALVLVEPQPHHQVSQEQALVLVLDVDVGGQQITVQQLRDNYIQTPRLERQIIKLRAGKAQLNQSVRRWKQICQKKTKQIQVLKNDNNDEAVLAMRGKSNANFTVGNHVSIALRRSIGHYGAKDFQFANLTPISSWSVRKAECVASGYVNNTQIGKIGSPHHGSTPLPHLPDFRPHHIPAPRRCSHNSFMGIPKLSLGSWESVFLGPPWVPRGLTQQKINK